VLWGHGGDLAEYGFRLVRGHARWHGAWVDGRAQGAETSGCGAHVSTVRAPDRAALLNEACLGQWGHKQVEPTAIGIDDGAVVLGLVEGGATIGICQFRPDDRVIDGPGDPRHADRPT
jgi:hypothetical protein